MKKKVVTFVALMLASLMIFSLGAKLARADQGIYEKSPEINAKSYLLTDFDGTTEIASSNKTESLPIASMVKISQSSKPVTLAVANLYLRQQIIFERV